jgi:steroid 5-alpha reductase family enzyme
MTYTIPTAQEATNFVQENLVSPMAKLVKQMDSLESTKQVVLDTLKSLPLQKRANMTAVTILLTLAMLTKQVKAALISLLFNVLTFHLHAWPNQSDMYYDTIGALTHLSLVFFSVLKTKTLALRAQQIVPSMLSVMWSTRLGVFLFTRILCSSGGDSRLTNIKQDYHRFLFAFLVQSVWCFVGQLPVLVSNAATVVPVQRNALHPSYLLFLLGLGVETISDAQKSVFRISHPDGFITTGLWKYSRHPNYLGEIMLQFALTWACSVNFTKWMDRLAWLSPVMTAYLLVKVSGIPLVEHAGMKRFGTDPNYQKYLQDTPLLIPISSSFFTKPV